MNELKAIDGTICSTKEELEKVNKVFWENIFVSPKNTNVIYQMRFKSYYEAFINNLPNNFEKWLSMYNDFKFLLNQNLLNPNFSRIFAGILILYKPIPNILNEFFQIDDVQNDLIAIYNSLVELDIKHK